MSKSLEEVKTDLMKLALPYLRELEVLLDQNDEATSSKKIEEVLGAFDSTDATLKSAKNSQLMKMLSEFQNVIRAVYQQTAGTQRPLPNLIDYINHFNSLSVINFPTKNIRVHTLVSNLQSLSESDIDETWIDSFESEKIDLIANTNSLFNYLTYFNVKSISQWYGFVHTFGAEQNKFEDPIVFTKADQSRLILADVRYRNTIADFRSIVLRAVSTFRSYETVAEFPKKSLIVIVYSQEQEYEVSKAEAKFRKYLVEVDETLIHSIYFITVSLFKLEQIESKLEYFFRHVIGFEVAFDYEDSPLSHGWEGSTELLKMNSGFGLEADSTYGRVLKLRLPVDKDFYFDYPLVYAGRDSFHSVSFIVKPVSLFALYIRISVKESDNHFRFNITRGTEEPKWFSGVEFEIQKEFVPQGDWFLVKINVVEEFGRTFALHGLSLDRIEGVRLRGEIDVAKIYFE
ncbi:MAG: hypothetical protein ACK5DD_05165 [Cyclobacteriaceae bacterium]|jgi:hypothetical protein